MLADYTSYSGNFSTVAIQCLEKCPTDGSSKFSFTCDRHTFNYVVSGGYSTFFGASQVNSAHYIVPACLELSCAAPSASQLFWQGIVPSNKLAIRWMEIVCAET